MPVELTTAQLCRSTRKKARALERAVYTAAQSPLAASIDTLYSLFSPIEELSSRARARFRARAHFWNPDSDSRLADGPAGGSHARFSL